MGGREENGWLIGEERLLGAEVLNSRAEDRTGRRLSAKRAEVCSAKRALPDECSVPYEPRRKAARHSFAGLWQRKGNPTDVVPAGHGSTVAPSALPHPEGIGERASWRIAPAAREPR